MVTYNIPGVTTSVQDFTNIKTANLGGETVLVVGPSKLGSSNIMELTDPEEAKILLGGVDIQKYGLAVYYAIKFLNITGKVLFKRLVAKDAKIANISIDKDLKIVSTPISDELTLIKSDNNLSIYADGYGDGYNSFFVKFSPAPDVEKVYADDDGDLLYNYNFLRASIFQQTPNGVKTIASNVVVSLIDTDPRLNNAPILDVTTGKSLYITDKFNASNKFVNLYLNTDKLTDIKKYLNVNDILKEKNLPEVILKDTETGINYKVKGNSEHGLYLEATSKSGYDKLVLKYYHNSANNFKKLYVKNGELKIDTDLNVNDGYEELYIEGDNNFLKLYIEPDTQNLKVVDFNILRSDLYKTLINNTFYLQNGSDGENFIINDKMNFSGPGSTEKPNVKMAMLDFINNDKVIREVMYPQFDISYVVDWTSDLDVMTAWINYTDDVGFTTGILGLPLAYDPNQDYKTRTELLYQSNYHCALYSGQWNLKHYDEFSGKTIAMPQTLYQAMIHLKVDNEISITEPAAGIVKAQLPVANVQLSYVASSADIEKLRFQQINTIIKETSGIYTIDQLTMYKKASALSRINLVKVIHKMRRDIPKLLKPYLQTKEIDDINSAIYDTVSSYMNRWKVTQDNTNPDAIFKNIDISIQYIKSEYKSIVTIRVTPIGTIEQIDVPIILENEQ